MNLEKRVLVTGASRGIGRAIAIELAQSGYYVIIHYNQNLQKAQETLKSIQENQGQANLIKFNLTNRKECQEVLQNEISQNGAFYGVVCNAGICKDGPFPMMSDEDWDSVIDTNLGGFYNVVKPLVMPMVRLKQGRIVVLSSVSGIMGNRGQVNYSASKAGLIGAVKSLAVELGKRNITVNCVAPGLIDTEMLNEEIIEHAKKLIPLQRIGRPEEVSALVNFLMSEPASYITRQVISVNGGMI